MGNWFQEIGTIPDQLQRIRAQLTRIENEILAMKADNETLLTLTHKLRASHDALQQVIEKTKVEEQ